MQRPAYSNPPPAHSPPLHHPVPQHVSSVPQLRSPPPPAPQSQPQNSYGYPQQQGGGPGGGGGGYAHPAFGGFMNDPTAQMGFQVGKSAVMAGQEYMEQNVRKHHMTFIWLLQDYSEISILASMGLLINYLRIVQPLRQCQCPKTLLQRLKLLRRKQALYRALPMAAPAMVAATASLPQRTGRLLPAS